MLHALRLGFVAPGSGEPLEFEMPPPEEYVVSVGRFT
jgi:hypothetical protein